MIASSKIREALQRLVEAQMSIDDFEDWLVQASWDMHSDSDSVARALVSSIELRLAEHSSGHLSFEQMIEEFRSLLGGFVVLSVCLNAEPIMHWTGASVKIAVVRQLALSAERQSLTVYA